MEQIAAFMLLVGCSSDLGTCTEVPVPVAAYESVDACRADLSLQMRLSGSPAPKMFGACTQIDSRMFHEAATVAWEISGDGRLIVDVETDHNREPQRVASR
ncbi:hypothetical protein [Consotaella salsifontis]|uniref:Uncharacterized protein n=1 Tax=Consotaella salsifontis TaxID=1365950 RepID=A0A1T4NU99_9HYPH|nr:hypothetical protein [Consotaella salsifontis]SJZ82811.1 hypothetical protein SAMN05428963_103192 [Consotaella salsifontis]